MNVSPVSNFLDRVIKNNGEMGRLTRAHAWNNTVLGPPESWPQSLRTTLGILLNSKFPMFLWWGPELICFYNDAYRPSLGDNGKHPNILGMKAQAAWPEIWAFLQPLLDEVYAGGSVYREDQLVPIWRNGKLEDVYWTYGYSPVFDESDTVAGVLVTCTETTEKVRNVERLITSGQRFRSMMEQAPVAIATFIGLDFVIELYNDKVLEFWGRRAEQVSGKPLFEALPEAAGQGFEELLTNVYTTGERLVANELPVTLERGGKMEQTWINFIYEALRDEQGEIYGILVVCNEITQQVDARRAVQQLNEDLLLSNRRLSDTTDMLNIAIDAAGLGIWRANLLADELEITDITRQLLGLAPDQQLGFREAMQMIHPEHRQRVKERLATAVSGHTNFFEEYPVCLPDGTAEKWLAVTGKIYHNAGQAVSITGTLLDITEQKRNETRKNDFIGMVSHELKTPLTSLSALLQVMQLKLKNAEDGFLGDAVVKATAQTRKMTAMINGFLNVSRLESGKILVDRQPFELCVLISDIISELQLTVHSHRMELTDCLEVTVNADRDKIGSVITNLLSNAVKYTPKNTTIRIHSEADGENVTVRVADEGPGINPEEQAHLFDRYYRSETSQAKHVSGFGIGLYLCAEIIRHHNGRIGVDSEMGGGSTFYFSLPLD